MTTSPIFIRARLLFSLCISIVTFTACSAGRQATWERDVAKKLGGTDTATDGTYTTNATSNGNDNAQEMWVKRSDKTSLKLAISAWEARVQADPADSDALTKLARGYYFLADTHIRSAGDKALMLGTFEKGVAAGERAMLASSEKFAAAVKKGTPVEEAISLLPDSAQPALYWYNSNLGKFAVGTGFTTVLFYKNRLFAVMERVLKIDERFFYAAPHRYFGAFYAKAPSFAGGDMEKSKKHFDTAIAQGPQYLGTKVLYAEYYAAKAGEQDLFEKLLNEVLAADPAATPELTPENTAEQVKAKKLLTQIEDLF